MPTLEGLRRRGYIPQSINDFVDLVGVTRRGNENMVSIKLLEHCIRKSLDGIAVRYMSVIHPLKLVISGDLTESVLNVPDFPAHPEKGSHTIIICKEVFIDEDDFKESPTEDFFGLGPERIV